MTESSVIDAAGRRRSPATMPGYHAGRPQRNKGMRYPADPPTVQEIVAVMRLVVLSERHRRVGWRARFRANCDGAVGVGGRGGQVALRMMAACPDGLPTRQRRLTATDLADRCSGAVARR